MSTAETTREIRRDLAAQPAEAQKAALLRIFDQLYPETNPTKEWSPDDLETISAILISVADGRRVG